MELLTPKQLAGELDVPVKRLYAWAQSGRGPTVYRPGGKSLRYKRADVEAWLEASRVDDGRTVRVTRHTHTKEGREAHTSVPSHSP